MWPTIKDTLKEEEEVRSKEEALTTKQVEEEDSVKIEEVKDTEVDKESKYNTWDEIPEKERKNYGIQ